tara:strand:- start:783 stop:1301 length:519 start_codon:yes stop_codon:yes gene_type:complete
MSKIYAMYDDDATLLHGAEKLVAKGVPIKEVFSPFPIHGIDPVIGVRKTRLAICAFIYGLTGMTLALIGMYYFMIQDWPMNIGGKPNHYMYQNIPAFIPITFEVTVLCTAHGMAITYFLRNKTLPGISAKNPDPRTTDDKFVMEIHVSDAGMQEEDLVKELKETGAIEINKA